MTGIGKVTSIIIWLGLVGAVLVGDDIQMPVVNENTPIELKLDDFRIIKEPGFDFTRVYSRQVEAQTDNSTQPFAPCTANKPEIEFDVEDEVVFKGVPVKPLVIADFADIRYSQFLLDMFKQDLTIFLIFKNGLYAVLEMSEQSQVLSTNVGLVQGLPGNTNLELGYFIEVRDQVLFINGQYAIVVDKQRSYVLEDYQETKNEFQNAVALDDGYFAVGSTTNLNLYYYGNGSLENVEKLISDGSDYEDSNKNSIEVMDVAFIRNESTIVVLDRLYGVRFYQYSIEQDEVEFIEKGNSIEKKNCESVYVFGYRLYLDCGRIEIFDLKDWPIAVPEGSIYPTVKVRQIYQLGDIVAYVGRNGFTITYLGSKVNYFDDEQVDRLLLFGNSFVSANEGKVFMGRFTLIKPYVTCITSDPQYLGYHPLVFTTTAECSPQYVKNYRINPKLIEGVVENSKCVYRVRRTLYLWQGGEIKTQPFLWVVVGIVGVLGLAGLYFCAKHIRIRRVQNLVDEFMNLGKKGQEGKPHELVEEEVEDGNQKCQKDPYDLQRPTEQELNKGSHDI